MEAALLIELEVEEQENLIYCTGGKCQQDTRGILLTGRGPAQNEHMTITWHIGFVWWSPVCEKSHQSSSIGNCRVCSQELADDCEGEDEEIEVEKKAADMFGDLRVASNPDSVERTNSKHRSHSNRSTNRITS